MRDHNAESRMSRAFGLFAAFFFGAAMPCLAGELTITTKQAREYVNGYFGLAVMYAAVASECDHVPEGRLAGRYGSMGWEGHRDVNDLTEKAGTYHALRLEMMTKLVAVNPKEKAEFDASVASAGGETGLSVSIRASMRQGLPEFQQRGLGKTELCASFKSVVMNTAAQIGQAPDVFRIVP